MGMMIKRIFVSSGFILMDITRPPTSKIGTVTSTLSPESMKSCIPLMSLVVLVIREGTPILSMSLWERLSTL